MTLIPVRHFLSPAARSASLLLAFLSITALTAAPPADELAPLLVTESGVKGGFVVHLGCTDGALTAALRRGESYMVHGLAADSAAMRKAREHVHSLGLYGPVSVDRLRGPQLPYADNLVNLLVLSDDCGVRKDEMLRVLAPRGVLLQANPKSEIRNPKSVKPVPDGLDDWTHYLYDATNNAVSQDSEVHPPRHLQWVGSPKWSRHHDRMASMSALVSAKGRLFYILDEGSRASVQLPPRWRLVARDAFNGTILWKRPIPAWFFHLWPLKSGPAQLPRRLVAVGDRVFVTLGLKAPVSVLDAATGETLTELPGTAKTEEIVVSRDVVFCQVNPNVSDGTPFVPDRKGVWNDTRRVEKEAIWDTDKQRRIVAAGIDGTALWTHEDAVAPLTLAVDDTRVYYHDGESVVALSRGTGERLWRSERTGRRKTFSVAFAPTLVLYKDVVLFGGGDNVMTAVEARSGKKLWNAKHHPSGHHSPRDILVAGGLAWCGEIAGGQQSGVFTGRDPVTGEVKNEFRPDVSTYWFHQRCYRSKATEQYLLPSRTGIEFVDFRKQHWQIHHWVRGGCIYGIIPSNGLVYAPPHSCACYLEAKLFGLNALAPTRKQRPATPPSERLERGPAYGAVLEPQGAAVRPPSSWPMYRADPVRSGRSDSRVPSEPGKLWQTELGGRLSSVVVDGGRLLVSAIDQHTVHALDISTGARVWSFTAGGRVDSPPTLVDGRAVFGCADGAVYCLRVSDGELIWRFRAAPDERRIMSFEQLESAWPVSGSVLVRDNVAHFVAGRSMFLDGGMRLCGVEVPTGRLISETVLDERDPGGEGDLHSRVKILNMPTALPDILSSDGSHLYMRSQRLGFSGDREEATPAPTEPAELAKQQEGNDRHLFCPAGFLDDAWFHRSYWLYGRRYSSGCNWWHRAGQATPAGRILVFDNDNVYGFGRDSSYFRWSVPLEYRLFAAGREGATPASAAQAPESTIEIAKSESLNPAGKPISVSVWIKPEAKNGVVLCRGGASHGFALQLIDGHPAFLVRAANELTSVKASVDVTGDWHHVACVLSRDAKLRVYVDGKLTGETDGTGLLTADPHEAMQLGTDAGSQVGEYERDKAPRFKGTLDELRIYAAALGVADIAQLADFAEAVPAAGALALHYSFDNGDARDDSGKDNHGGVGTTSTTGRFGKGMAFSGKASARGSANQRAAAGFSCRWSRDVPVLARAMALTGDVLFVAGPPDVVDEDASFNTPHDEATLKALAEQDAALNGQRGALLLAVSPGTGETLSSTELSSPPTWDGMAAAGGRLFLSTLDGHVVCLGR